MNISNIDWQDFKNGNNQAIEKIYISYIDVLFRYASKLSADRELVKDSIQQLFVELISSNKLGNPNNLEFYLMKGIKRIVFKQIKKQIKRQKLESGELCSFEISFVHHDTEADSETRLFNILDEELQKLPPYKKELLFLKFYSGLTNKEIGKIVGLKSGAVQKQIYRLLKKFRVHFRQKMVEMF